MNHRKSSMGRSRDFGLPTGPGKGDKSRVTDQTAYAQNFDEIDWGHGKDKTAVHSYDFRTGKFVSYPETDGEWPDNPPHRDEPCCASVTNDLIRE